MLGYKLDIDGDFGPETEKAVKKFQNKYQLVADGKYGPKSHEAMMDVLSELDYDDDDDNDDAPIGHVQVIGGTVNVRKGCGTKYEIVTVVRKGTKLPYSAVGSNGWYYVEIDGLTGWISNKYTVVVSG